MEIFLKRDNFVGFTPVEQSDVDKIMKLKKADVYRCEIKLARNYEFHKKFFAMINVGHNATKLDLPFDVYRKVMTMKAGFFKAYKTDKGTYFEPDSISFGNMTEERFQEVYSRVLDVILQDTNLTKEVIEKELVNFF